MISVFAIRAGRHVREPRQWYTEGRADAVQRILFDIRYLFRPPWDTRISPPELLDYIGSHRAGAALDLGCGTGTNVLTLAAAGWNTSGVDFSRLAICLARRRLRQSGLRARLMAADVTRPLPLAETYDLVLDIGCFYSMSNWAVLSSGRMHDMLSPIEVYIRKHLRFNFTIGMLDGGFFGLGMGFASFSAIIPLFVHHFTD